MFRPISNRFVTRQTDLAKNNSKQETLNSVISKFLHQSIGLDESRISFKASLEKGNLYISVPSKALTNEIVFKARDLYSALKQNRIVCNNLIIR